MSPRDGREGVEDRIHVTDVKYPQLNLRVWMEGNCFLTGAISMFHKAGCTKAKTLEEADLVVFLGGADIDPSLYGEQAMRGTSFDTKRDEREIATFTKATELGIPMFGICRGMQFLHVMNGGKLYQHVPNHAGMPHRITDVQTGEVLIASSLHHQMCIENGTTFPIAYAVKGCGRYEEFGKVMETDSHKDLEGAVYPNINAIAVQGHPELGDIPTYTAWSLNKIKEFLEEKLPTKMGDNAKKFAAPVPTEESLRDIAFLNQSVIDRV